MADSETGAAEQPADLRSMIADAANEAEETAAQREQPTPETGAGEAAEGADAGAEGEAATGERQRGPDGKFVAKDKAATEDGEKSSAATAGEEKAAGAPEGTETKTVDQAPAAAAAAAIEAPAHWSAADKQWLAGIPAEHQASVLDRFKQMDAGYQPKLQRLASYERDYQGVPEIFAPHAAALREQGKTPAHVIHSWAGVEQGLLAAKAAAERGQSDENGAAIVARMIKGYGINPADVARILTSGAAEQQQQQPARSAVPPEVAERLNRLETAEQERLAAHNQQRIDTAQQQIDAFANQKDGAGNPKNPFFADVMADIEALAAIDKQRGKTLDLADLYDRAVNANPETRKKLLALQTEAAGKQAAIERKAKSEAAQRASVSVTGAPGGASQAQRQSPTGRSLRDTISDAAAEAEAA